MANTIWEKATELGLTYAGDSSLEYGGVFYAMNSDDYSNGYIEAVRLDPCSDAGAQDNAFWLEWLTLNIPQPEAEIKQIIRCCGFKLTAKGNIVDESSGALIAEKGTAQFMQVIAESCVSHGAYDKDEGLTLQVGAYADGGSKSDRIRPDDIDVWLSDSTDFEQWVLWTVCNDSEKRTWADEQRTDRDSLKAEKRLKDCLERQSDDCGACPFRGKDCTDEDCPDEIIDAIPDEALSGN